MLSGDAARGAVAFEKFLSRWGAAVILLAALAYYALYWRTGLNLGGEGGSNAVLAMRIMEGKRPIADTFLGYNLMWFYPLVAIFGVTGPHYLAMRVFFFALCALNAVLGYSVVRATTGKAWLSTGIGILLVIAPGMLFRNYMGLIGTLSALLFLRGYVLPAANARRQIARMAAAGAGLALCFLIRIEPSLLLAVVWLGLAALYPFGRRDDFVARLRVNLLGTAAAAALLLGIHGLFGWHAYARGFGPQFVGQYAQFVSLLRRELTQELRARPAAQPPAAPQAPSQVAPPPPAAAAATAPPQQAPQVAPAPGRDARLGRPPLTDAWNAKRSRERYFVLAMYYPIFWSVAAVGASSLLLLAALWKGDDENKQRALVVLTTTGCALALFPQYFFFRPDAPHFSEFMVAFLPAVASSAFALWQASRNTNARVLRAAGWLMVAASAFIVPVYLKGAVPREDAGTFFWTDTLVRFRALNGVDVLLEPGEARAMEGLRDAVLQHSAPGEFLVCYPYSPTINLMTDRPSYEYNLYIDDATADSAWQGAAIERMRKNRPSVVVIDNRAINGADSSRFKNWARSLTAHIKSQYRLVGSFAVDSRDVEVYARPDKTGTAD